MKRLLVLLPLFVAGPDMFAQDDAQENQSLLNWFKEWRERSLLSDMDSGYIAIPEYPWLASINYDVTYDRFGLYVPNTLDLGTGHITFSSELYNKLSFGLYYRGWGLTYGTTLSDTYGSRFTFSSYGQTIGFDINYEQHGHMSCDMSIQSDDKTEVLNMPNADNEADFSLINVNLYYVFNSRRFSYGSALGQTSLQQRSGGSVIAALSYYQTKLDFSGTKLASFLFANQAELTTRQLAIGLGYGYNFVPQSKLHFLLHGSLAPMLLVPIYNSFHLTSRNSDYEELNVDGQEYFNSRRADMEDYVYSFAPSVLFVFRGAVYWLISPHWITGITSIVTAYPALRTNTFATYTIQGSAFAYVGFMF